MIIIKNLIVINKKFVINYNINGIILVIEIL